MAEPPSLACPSQLTAIEVAAGEACTVPTPVGVSMSCGVVVDNFHTVLKFQLLSGDFNRHVYYRCTKKVNLHCPEKYINEVKLEELLLQFVEKNLNKIKLSETLQGQIERHYVVTESLVSYHEMSIKLKDPIVEYTRYVLSKGSYTEKAEFTRGVKSNLIIKDGSLKLAV
jgi:hypothetical protein